MAVHAGLVTMSENGHPKGIGTFNTMKKNIGIPDGVKLVVNYITLPYQADRYANGSRSYFFSDDNDVGITEIQRAVDFRVIKMSLPRYHDAAPMSHDRRIRARRAHLTAKTLRWHSRRLPLLLPAIPPPIGYADPTLRPPRHPLGPEISPPAV
ncbi:hypothetical protein H257_04654 [Aphanomyces astaci]|uniref:Uncharacterized protein n=1 Tax=Aphanomyces astaci TaxID=112090 RepID=W4GV18_APHAT|nr:hypothetical protein H257_04654 [Aphanomyces astaci]ETV82879.1 hypothetical protein H257_04654 [Aphanomyces astaci]|eukprot:XP_009827550.1 hypothetical protein H257_04654 [Aphanomyces astaci]